MTIEKLNALIHKYHIPQDTIILSNSGWECDSTDTDGVFYDEQLNVITLTQGACYDIRDYMGQKCLYCEGIDEHPENEQRIISDYKCYINKETRIIEERFPFNWKR